MIPFALAGGGAEATDLCFFCPAFTLIGIATLLGLISLEHGAARARLVALIMLGVVGLPLFLGFVTYQPTDDPDERGSVQMLRWLLVFWALATVLSLSSAIAAARRKGAQKINGEPSPEHPADTSQPRA